MLPELVSISFLAAFTVLAWSHFSLGTRLLAALLPAYLLHLSLFGLPTNVLEIAVLILVVIGFGKEQLWSRSKLAVGAVPRTFIYSVLIFLGAAALSTALLASQPVYARHALGVLKGWIVVPLLAAWIITIYNHTEKARLIVLRSMACSGVIVVLYGLLYSGLFERLNSFYDEPNSVALFLVPLIIFLLWYGEVMNYVLAAVLFIGLIATQSIGGAIATGCALVVGWLTWRRTSKSLPSMLFIFVVLCLVLAYFTLTGRVLYALQTFSGSVSTSWNVRLQLWSIGATLVARHPLLGVGLGQFEPAYQAVLHERFYAYEQLKTSPHEPLREFVFRDPHLFLLSFWLNTGIVGLFAWLALYGAAARQVIKSPTRFQQAIFLALLGTLLFGLVDTIYWKNDLATQWWILLGVLAWRAEAVSTR